MSNPLEKFTGLWLHHGSRRGQAFSHDANAFDHPEDDSGEGATPMRHALITQEGGGTVGVWVPANWSDEQAREALETNW